jgi:hypothetical protein
MPIFDRNKPPEKITPEIIDDVNALIDRLGKLKVKEIILPEPGTGFRLSNLIRCYIVAHVRRCLVFLEAGAAEIEAGRGLATELCTRAIYENVATICDFADRMKPLLKSADYSAIEQYVSKCAFQTRIPSFLAKSAEDIKAPQILNQIDRMGKRYPNFREAYDHLSDIVHPNGLGAVVYFATISKGVARFADAGNNPERARTSLILAALLLAHVELAVIELEQQLQKLSAGVVTTDATNG